MMDISYVRELLLQLFDGIINKGEMRIDVLEQMDSYYRKRVKTDYYKSFRRSLGIIHGKYRNDSFTYVIWGAGNHSLFAYQLMSEMYPKAKLIAVVDRFKKGTKFGVPIIAGKDISLYMPDHVCISTKPGLEDALSGCKEIYGDDYKSHYTIVSSQQES